MIQLTPEIEIALYLLISSTIVVAVGLFLTRYCRTACSQSFVWKSVTLATSCLLLLELSGTGECLGRLIRCRLPLGDSGLTSAAAKAALPIATDSKNHFPSSGTGEGRESHEGSRDRPRFAGEAKQTTPVRLAKLNPREERSTVREGMSEASPRTAGSAVTPEAIAKTSVASELAFGLHLSPNRATTDNANATNAKATGRWHVGGWWSTIWLVGNVIFLLPSIFSGIYVVGLHRQFSPVDEALNQRLDRIRLLLNIDRPICLFCHPRISAPIAVGTLRPTIIVPTNFATEFTREQQASVFAHELSHLASRDNLWLKLNMIGVALVWWCPPVWYARKRLRSAMEMAADEASLCLPDGPRHLADCLVKVGRILTSRPSYGLLGMAGHASRSSLAARVQRLLQTADAGARPARSGVLIRVGVVILVLFSSVLPGVVVRAEHPSKNGETGMQLLKQSWQRSLVAGLAGTFIAPGLVAGQEDVNVEIEVTRSGDGHEEREVRVDRQRVERQRVERQLGRRERAVPRRRELQPEADEALRKFEARHEAIARRLQELERALSVERDSKRRAQLKAERKELEAALADTEARLSRRLADYRSMQQTREQHVKVAIENLIAAGLHEHAERLEKEILHRASGGDRRNPFAAPRSALASRPSHEPVNEFRFRNDDRANRDMIGIRREMDEMREQMHEMRMMMQRLVRRAESEPDDERFRDLDADDNELHDHDDNDHDEERDDDRDDDDREHDRDDDHDDDERSSRE